MIVDRGSETQPQELENKFIRVNIQTRTLLISILAPVAETGFSHRLTAYRILGHFFGLPYLNMSGNNQVENSFFRISNISPPCPHVQLRGRAVNRKLWTFVRTLGSRSLSVTAMSNFSGKANTSIHGLGEDDTAISI